MFWVVLIFLVLFLGLLFIWAVIYERLVQFRVKQHVAKMGAEIIEIERFQVGPRQGKHANDLFVEDASRSVRAYSYLVTYRTAEGNQVVRVCRVSLFGSFFWLGS